MIQSLTTYQYYHYLAVAGIPEYGIPESEDRVLGRV
jgi:hypothetical protein